MAIYSSKIGGLDNEITDPTEGMSGYNSRGQRVIYDARQDKWVLPQNYVAPGSTAPASPTVTRNVTNQSTGDQTTVTYTNSGVTHTSPDGTVSDLMTIDESSAALDAARAEENLARVRELGGDGYYDGQYYHITDANGNEYKTTSIWGDTWQALRAAAGQTPTTANPWYEGTDPADEIPGPLSTSPEYPSGGPVPGSGANISRGADEAGKPTPPSNPESTPPPWFQGKGGGGSYQPPPQLPPWMGQIPGGGKGGGYGGGKGGSPIVQPPSEWAPGGGWTPGGGMPGTYPPGYGGGYIAPPIERPPAAPPPWYQPGVATYDPYSRGRNLSATGYAEGGTVDQPMTDMAAMPPKDQLPTTAPMPPVASLPQRPMPFANQPLLGPGMFPGQGQASGKGGFGQNPTPPGMAGGFPGQGNATGKGGFGSQQAQNSGSPLQPGQMPTRGPQTGGMGGPAMGGMGGMPSFNMPRPFQGGGFPGQGIGKGGFGSNPMPPPFMGGGGISMPAPSPTPMPAPGFPDPGTPAPGPTPTPPPTSPGPMTPPLPGGDLASGQIQQRYPQTFMPLPEMLPYRKYQSVDRTQPIDAVGIASNLVDKYMPPSR